MTFGILSDKFAIFFLKYCWMSLVMVSYTIRALVKKQVWWDASNSQIDAYFISLDFKKTFNSIDQHWLSRVLQKMNFPAKFIHTINSLNKAYIFHWIVYSVRCKLCFKIFIKLLLSYVYIYFFIINWINFAKYELYLNTHLVKTFSLQNFNFSQFLHVFYNSNLYVKRYMKRF